MSFSWPGVDIQKVLPEQVAEMITDSSTIPMRWIRVAPSLGVFHQRWNQPPSILAGGRRGGVLGSWGVSFSPLDPSVKKTVGATMEACDATQSRSGVFQLLIGACATSIAPGNFVSSDIIPIDQGQAEWPTRESDQVGSSNNRKSPVHAIVDRTRSRLHGCATVRIDPKTITVWECRDERLSTKTSNA